MSRKLRVLITGFGPFPGAPHNPTERLVARLLRLRRPALGEVRLIGHVFHVSYGAVDHDFAEQLAVHEPDALLMFGLAQRTPYVRIETCARNVITPLWPDADHARLGANRIAHHDLARRQFGPHTTLLLQAARNSGVWIRSSRDAGRYLCNYLCWKAITATGTRNGPRLAAFVHVPTLPHSESGRLPAGKPRVSFEELVDAGEAMLLTLVKLVRQSSIGHV